MTAAGQDLRCTSELEISRRLKLVAMWAMGFGERIHFEWVWNGNAVRIVQAQLADSSSGIEPSKIIPAHLPALDVCGLKSFRLASEQDYESYRKLRNAKMYTEIGFAMPNFYVLDCPRDIKSILSGKLPLDVRSDLTELTKRDLILRTDGRDIPKDKREMLPRSDELRSPESAANWLVNDFALKIEQGKLAQGELCVLAHHFIPSVASAWARAEPGNRIVRIESLWGIPEGLYWYSHDTFEVDTIAVDISAKVHHKRKYKVRERLRYKGSFIGPDDHGIWIPYQTKQPFDWKSSIRRREWLTEIAHTTRIVSEREGFPVSLMWFLDNHPESTTHEVLPWFHDQSDLTGPIKAAPRKKFRSTKDSVITTTEDWSQLKEDIKNGKRIERVIVEPADAELIRNRKFAEELGKLAATNRFVVELAGGILSHVFYILRKEGAQVECKDLYGDEEDIVEYDKLVRDKIPSLIEARGEHVRTIKLEGQALITALLEKLVEEAFEAKDARDIEELVGEIADIQEVIRGLAKALEVSLDEIALAQEQKQQKRGGFDSGTMLIRTATPHSIQKPSEDPDNPPLILNFMNFHDVVISDPLAIPTKPAYRRPDLRQLSQQIEKLFTFETELNKVGNRRFDEPLKQTLNFSLPIGSEVLNVTLSIELVRSGSSLRGVIRLRPGALQLPISYAPAETQLTLEFPEE
jgi:predicted house-cleaning noncanonical NTP pyrophosphatase (MazG superfamily)